MNNWWQTIRSYFALTRYAVSKKIAVAYLLIVVFSLASLIYALTEMREQARQSNTLVQRDFTALTLSRELRGNLLAQERLEQQYLILKDKDLLFLLEQRETELTELWHHFANLPLDEDRQDLVPLMDEYRKLQPKVRENIEGNGRRAESFVRDTITPLRSKLIGAFDEFRDRRSAIIDDSLQSFADNSRQAYRVTLLLLVLGVGLSIPVGMSVILGIHGAITRLTRAVKKVANGQFDVPLEGHRKDEFGQLAREFKEMAEKLRELEQARLDANPLTHLPGNRAIERELAGRIKLGTTFAHLYIDLDHFKAYNDRYGYRRGSDIIARTADLIQQATAETGESDDLVGHIGGDDYVVVTIPQRAEAVAARIIELFDAAVPEFYSAEDRSAGSFTAHDRYGELRHFPLMSMSIAIVCSDNMADASPQSIGHECAKMKDHLKSKPGSNYLFDRRKR